MNSQPLRVIVVGGGAAGFFGAIACAHAHPQTQVTLLEAGRQLLAKVRISGGGRCNVTHACFESGFNNLSYFNRQFKQVMKVSPQQYQKWKKAAVL